MNQSDFIVLIKKETEKMVNAWNNDRGNVLNHMTVMETLIGSYACFYTEDVTVFEVKDMNDNHPLYELCSLAAFAVSVKKEKNKDEFDEVLNALEDIKVSL